MPFIRARDFRRGACFALLLGATGCAGMNDPFQRKGTWQLEHVNDANLTAMVADRNHLAQGVGDDASPGALSAAAVDRLLTDRVKRLAVPDAHPFQTIPVLPGVPAAAMPGTP